MPRRSKKKTRATPKKARKAPRKAPTPTRTPAAQRFEEELITRGEAAVPNAAGELPPGVTHEIIRLPGGGTKLQRRRFSIT